ncbi:hypothetical protein GH733_016965 [Mirounga leonina]|nr:hypothetical protein GH733_016965 [Mirounga leonina]
MEIPERAQCHFSKGLLLSASFLALWIPQSSWAALHIQKIPEHPQKDQNLLLSIQGIPGNFQDFNWYLGKEATCPQLSGLQLVPGEGGHLSVQGIPGNFQDFSWYLGKEANGGTMLFTYFPDLQRPQRNGSAMGQRDIVGFPSGSKLLCRIQPTDSGTYQVAVTINPDWTMRAKTEVQVDEKLKELPITHLPLSAGIMAAIIIGFLVAGSLFIGCIAPLLLTRDWRGQSHRLTPTEKPEVHPNHNAGDQNIYEVMPSPTLLVSPPGDMSPCPSSSQSRRTTPTRGPRKSESLRPSPGGLVPTEKPHQRPHRTRPPRPEADKVDSNEDTAQHQAQARDHDGPSASLTL